MPGRVGARFARCTYATDVVRAVNGVASDAAIVPPIHSPQVSEPETKSPTNAPAWMTASSKMKARVAVLKAIQKCRLTSSLLRFKAPTEPRFSLRIAGANNDQRVSNH